MLPFLQLSQIQQDVDTVLSVAELNTQTDRSYDAERKLRARSAARDVDIPKIANRKRRESCLADPYLFLETYFGHRFFNPWTQNQRAMVDAIVERVRYGGNQSIAAPRGDGKTTIAECVSVYCVFAGLLDFMLIIAANSSRATTIMDNIKFELEQNDLLHADFPDICEPIRALERSAIRAKKQTVDGAYTNIRWERELVVMADVPGSPAAGAVLSTVGVDGAIRGLRINNKRPSFVLLDDVETRESARSVTQTESREEVIEKDVGGLAGQGQSVSGLMLCTIINHECLADRYTDRSLKPSWHGIRQRLIDEWPERRDMWERYIEMRQAGQESGDDPHGRLAHAYYLENRDEMDRGAVVTNPHRHVTQEMPDGSERESSTLEHCYNIIADRGLIPFLTECQNDPPEDTAPEDSPITSRMVASRLNRLPRYVMPSECQCVTRFVDVGQHRLHYATVAWAEGAAGYVVDYGVQQVTRPHGMTLEDALLNALRALRDESPPLSDVDGNPRKYTLNFVDAGHWNWVVYQFTRESGATWAPAMGLGENKWNPPKSKVKHRRPNYECYESYQPKAKLWAINQHTDFWKEWVHERFITEPSDANPRGTLTLWGDDSLTHKDAETGNFARQIVAEVYRVEPWQEGKGAREGWHKVHRDNHYLDCVCGAACAAGFLGVRLVGDTAGRMRRQQAAIRQRQVAERKRPERRQKQKTGGNPWVNRGR